MDNKEYRKAFLNTEKFEKERIYWLNKLSGDLSKSNVEYDYLEGINKEINKSIVEFKYEGDMFLQLMKLSNKSEQNLFMILLTILNVLIHKYTGNDDIVVTSPILKLKNKQDKNKLINTSLILRNTFSSATTFKELLLKVRKILVEANKNVNCPLEIILEDLGYKDNMELYDIGILLENIHDIDYVDDLKTNIIFSFLKKENSMTCKVTYNSSLYKEDTIKQLLDHMTNLLKESVNDINKEIKDIDILSLEEKERILDFSNNSITDYPKNKTIHRLFEEQVIKTPDNIALSYNGENVTYRELNERSNSLARRLRQNGVKQDNIVGLIVDRSIEMIIGLLGVLKAGGVYLPIDPDYPQDRIEYMLEDSQTNILLTKSNLIENMDIQFTGNIIDLEDEEIYKLDNSNIDNINKPNDLAYIIYTSGTTGKPKGVMIEHKNVVRLMFNDKYLFDFNEKDVWTMFHSYCFDFSVWEMYGSLLYGGKLVIIPKMIARDTKEFLNVLKKEKVTVLNQTPSAFYRLINEDLSNEIAKEQQSTEVEEYHGQASEIEKDLNIRYVIFGGEALKPSKLKEWKEKNKETKLINMYGITETTVHVTFKEIKEEEIKLDISNIGTPIPTLTTYVMDKNLNLLPIGIPGELCVGGEGVTRGYLNRPELTKEKFVINPYKPEEKIYRSGDLVRLLENGEMEYLGRIDNQVKIRGFRIELGEIENQLLKHKDIKEAVVLANEDENNDKYLCGYIVESEKDRGLTISELRNHLSKKLPEYMIPQYFVKLDEMPLTSNGKIDKKSLPKPDRNMDTGTEYESPRNEIEEKLVEIWEEILEIKDIGINDNFFDLGGHSLKATTLITKIHKELNVEVALQEIFRTSTIKGISEYISNSEKSIYSSIEVVEERKYYLLSSAQKRMYILNQFNKNMTNYNMPSILEIKGKLNIEKFEKVFRTLINRHNSLRTSFEKIGEEPVQIVHDKVDFEVEYTELDNLIFNKKNKENYKEKENLTELIQNIVKNFIKTFDLSKAPLLRVGLIKVEEEKYILMTDMHHIISDGVSTGILTAEFAKLYSGEELSELRIQYKDYAVWQQEQLQTENFKEQEKYWLEKFEGELPVLNLPTDYPRPKIQNFEGNDISFKIDSHIKDKLQELSKENTSTMYMILLAAYNTLLYKYTGQEDIIVGSPIAGRPHNDLQNIIGMFVNTLTMRNFPSGEKTFKDFLKEVKEDALKAYKNQDYQFEDLVEKLDIKRDVSRNPVFDTMFTVQNMDLGNMGIDNLKISPYNLESKTSKFDILLSFIEMNDEIHFNIQYCTKLFKKQTIERLGSHFKNILTEVCNNPEIKLSEIEVITENEKNQILNDFNSTKTNYPKDKTIQQLFEERVKETPNNIAVSFKGQELTYKELNEKANQLARLLRNKGVKVDSLVGLMVDRSIEMMIGIMGILKAGGAYVPIDPTYPIERINYILDDSGTKILVTDKSMEDTNIGELQYSGSIIDISKEEIYEENIENLEYINKSDNLAYIIYTSGSTGKPKGNLTMHYNITRVVKETNYIDIDSQDNILQLSNYAFDGSTFDIFGALLNGGKLVLVDKETLLNINKLSNFIKDNKITIFFVTTALFNTLVDINIKCLKDVRKVLFGGERVSFQHARKALSYLGKDKIIHVYGPTESTVYASYYPVNEIDEKLGTVPIGKPLSNTEIYILDKDNKLSPIGAEGELCISGDGLARGYLNRPELTEEKFVKNPFKPEERLYKTGDLAKWLPDGNIEFVGRIDNQVKIRGFRIELGEIEKNLLEHENIKEAIVIAKGNTSQDKYICGYIVADKEMKVEEIKKYLSIELPEYMIPKHIIQIEKMPMTSNGKIDKKVLPEADNRTNIEVEYQEPRNETEEKLVEIWNEILGVENIGINDNFFDLGGHSLKATILISKTHKEINVEIPLQEIFKTPTIKGISEYIINSNKSIYSSIKLVEEKENYPLSSAQKRMYLINQLNKNSTNYNMPSILEIDGKLDIERLENVFKHLINRHESLRTSFETRGEEPVQIIHGEVDFEIEYTELENTIDIHNSSDELSVLKEKVIGNILEDFVRAFDLSKASLLRVGLIKVEEEKYILMTDTHHIISDGVSTGILISEFTELYNGKELSELKIQYKDYAVWQQEQLLTEDFKSQEDYWIEKFEGELPVLDLLTDYPRPKIQSFEGNDISFKIDSHIKDKLQELSKENTSTMYMILLAAYNTLLYKYTGQEDIIVGSPIAGRPHNDLESLIGMFVNTLAMRNFPSGEKTFKDFLKEVKEDALKAYKNQDYQFEDLVEKLDIKRDTSRNPLFDTMLVVQNMEFENVALDDLQMSTYNLKNNTSKFDILLSFSQSENEIDFNIQYCTKLFKEETIERLGIHVLNVLKEICNNPEVKLREIEIATEKESEQILNNFNDTETEYPKQKTIHQLFEKQVTKTPNNIAVAYKGQEITYKELSEKSAQLANILRNKGVKEDTIIGIMIDKSIEMIIGILGILKAGGAYLPIASHYPSDRIKYMLEDSEADILLTQEKYKEEIDFDGEFICLNTQDLNQPVIANKEDYNKYKNDIKELNYIEHINKSNDLAYIMYTSGSTGKPKGVMVEHRPVVRLVKNTNYIEINENDRILQTGSIVFDASTLEIWGSLLNGATLHLVDKEVILDSEKLSESLQQNEISIIWLTSSLFNQLADQRPDMFYTCKYLLVGGDVVSPKHVNKVKEKCRGLKIINGYGPTENTTFSTCFLIEGDYKNSIPIGKPIANSKAYIVSNDGTTLQPIGVVGELCVAGDGLARGYLNKPDLTREKFVENPFETEGKMYKTGDLAKWLPDGNIEFIGRKDNQVKIRGFRIETGEIENRILKHKDIKEAVVLAREEDNNNKYLCGYIVGGKEVSTIEIREYLLEELPEYMIPSYFIQLDKMPLTTNGKVNREKLPEPQGKIETGVKYEAASNQIEEILVEVWKNTLDVENEIGINDNYFALGGDSIKAIQVTSRLRQYQYKLKVEDIFKYQTISELAMHVKKMEKESNQDIIEGEVKLTPIQKRFFKKIEIDKHHWNQSVILYRKEGIDPEIIKEVFEKIVEHHDALRIVAKQEKGEVTQINKGLSDKLLDMSIYDFTDLEDYEEAINKNEKKIQSSMDLENGPLVKLGLFKTSEGDHLLIAIHHLIIDGVSWRIIFEDMAKIYGQISEGKEIILPLKTTSYREWSEKLSQYANSEDIESEIEYWKQIEQTEVKSLPKDSETKENINKYIETVGVRLTEEDTNNLLKETSRVYNTEINDILLCALGMTIKDWTKEENILIDLEGHGREEIIEDVDITRTIGWFTSVYPIIINIENTNDIRDNIKNVKEMLRKIPNKGVGYSIIKYLTSSEKKKEIEFKLKPEISFNYLGQFDKDVNTEYFEASNIPSNNTISENANRTHKLDISGMVAKERLGLSISYNTKEYNKRTIEKLAKKFKENLLDIVNHCVEKDDIEVTLSDVSTFEKLDYEEVKDIITKDIKEIYSLSPMQKGMLFHYNMDEKSEAYFEQINYIIEGDMDLKLFEKSFNKLIDRYDILRTNFVYKRRKRPLQIIYKERISEIYYEDISYLSEIEKEKYIKDFKLQDRKKGFNLREDLLIRISILKIEDNKYEVVWSSHHIITDGWCLGIIIKDFMHIYTSYRNNVPLQLEPVKEYGEFIKWLNAQNIEEGKNYWKNYLQEYNNQVRILNYKQQKEDTYKQEVENLIIRKNRMDKLKKIAKTKGITESVLLQTLWGILLNTYNNTNDAIFGLVVSGRPPELEGVETMVGLFINTIPVRVAYEKEDRVIDVAKEIQKNSVKSNNYSYLSLAELQTQSSLNKDLINHLFVYENYPIGKEVEKLGQGSKTALKVKNMTVQEQTNYDFGVIIGPGEETIVSFKYNSNAYSKNAVTKISQHFSKLIDQVIGEESIQVKDLDILTIEEKNKLLIDFNDTKVEYQRDKVIHQLFEEQVEKTPDNVALVYGESHLTYRQLDEKGNRLARILRKKGVEADSIVGIMTDKSLEMVIGILAILKAGGGYLPISLEYPRKRIEYMLEDSGTKLLLTTEEIKDEVEFDGEIIDLSNEENYDDIVERLENINKTNDLAYIIYTSGSTGKPKGVMVEHLGLVNLNILFKEELNINENDKVLQFANISFDASVWEIFMTLLNGGELHIISKDITSNYNKFEYYLIKNRITVATLPPSYLMNLDNKKNYDLEKLITAGEASNTEILNNWKDKLTYINAYGPTESTICATIFRGQDSRIGENIVPIGKPIQNTSIYVLDKDNKLCPIGVPGELCISGDGLARGYLNRAELTKQKFIENPFISGDKIYKTGDLVRWLSDGNIEFLGRIDHQVKIRGFRIELGEIQNKLLNHQDIKETIVLAKEGKDKEKYICSYIVLNDEKELIVSELRTYLSKELPDYMIPSYFVEIEEMPLTPNGKIDRKALPEPEGMVYTGIEYEAPRNEIEEKLVKIWETILGVEKVGINEDFFNLGGHSLKATTLISKVHKEIDVEIPLKEIFKTPTIKGISEYIISSDKSIYSSIKSVEEQEYYPLSSAQKRLYVLNQFDKQSTNYNIPSILEIEGKLDTEKLEKVFRKLINRHESLRTSFEMREEETVQIIHEEVDFEIEYKELSKLSCNKENRKIYEDLNGITESMEIAKENLEEVAVSNDVKENIIENVVRNFIRPFDLSKASLLRVGLIKVEEEKYILMTDMHHIISDGVSTGILISEFAELYNGEELSELKIQYRDYAVWQQEQFKTEDFKKQEKYWLENFKVELPVLNLPTDYQRPPIQSFEGDNFSFKVDNKIKEKLKEISKENQSTIYMTLLAAYNTLLYKYTGKEDIIVGSPIAGRPHNDLEKIIGMFVNTLAMRNYPSGDKTFNDLLQEVKENSLKAYENQDYQFEELVEKLNIRRDTSRNPIFDTMFVLQNMNIYGDTTELDELKISPYNTENKIAKFDITLNAVEVEDGVCFNLEYSTKLFKKETIERLGSHFVNILEQIIKNPELKINDIDMMCEREKQQLLVDFNDTEEKYPISKTLHKLFEEQAKETPNNMAVVYESEKLTYKELNERANNLAKILINKGVKPETKVGIMVSRSPEIIIAILGILKAGGGYIPIDPEYPQDRIEYMLEDSQTKILVTQSNLVENIKFDGTIIDIKDESIDKENIENVEDLSKSNNLAYIIYTSGSTGKPKGVMVEHKSVVNLAFSQIQKFNIDENERVLQFSSICFDASVEQIFIALLSGAELVLIDKEKIIDIKKFEDYIIKQKVTHVHAVPTFLDNISSDREYSIKRIISGGDVCSVELAKKWYRKYEFYNEYGPTETTVTSIEGKVLEVEDNQRTLTIGKPIGNTKVYIVDSSNKLVPKGVAGELCIGGDGLARGYLNRPKLTKEKFVYNPFVKGEKMYKTGDLVKWTKDGNIEFLGRIDHQVKIRGFRIELGEIENQLLNHKDIKEAIVVAKEDKDGNKYLCGYIVGSEENKELTVSELREHINKELPEYMIPQYFVELDEMPLNANGKVNRKALPEPDGKIDTGTEYEAPRNETEEKLVEIWEGILGIKDIGINDNFFDLGGHSLKATSLMSRIHRRFNVEIPLQEIFRTPNIKELAKYINNTDKSIYSSIEPVEEKEYYPLSSAQNRMFVLNQLNKENTKYNMPSIVEINGQLDRIRLKKVFKQLINRHESFRTIFELVDSIPMQKIYNKVEFDLEYQEEREDRLEEVIIEFIRPFNLEEAPLLRVKLVKVSRDRHILITDMHHIISDGISTSILISEFVKLYNGEEISELRIQYKDYAVWQKESINLEKMKSQEEYWLSRFSGEIPELQLMTNYDTPKIRSFEGASVESEIKEDITKKLKEIIKDNGVTMYTMLLAAYNVLLSKYSNQEDIIVGNPIAGRSHMDLENIIGMFVNTLAIRNFPSRDKTFIEFLNEVNESTIKGFENQDYQFEELVDKLGVERGKGENPLFKVVFTMQNRDSEDLDIEGLEIRPYDFNLDVAKFDITLFGIENENKIQIAINYSTDLFNYDTIDKMLRDYEDILVTITENKDIFIKDIQLENEVESINIDDEYGDFGDFTF